MGEIVLTRIAKFLSKEDILTCRLVCSAWRKIIDDSLYHEKWHISCRKDFPNISLAAYCKSRLSWCQLYRSLKLWNDLANAQGIVVTLTEAKNYNEEIFGIQILSQGIIGVHSREVITYYDVHTLQQVQRRILFGNYLKYKENDYIISAVNYNKQLSVVFKSTRGSIEEDIYIPDIVEDVDDYLIMEKNIYCIANSDNLYVFELIEGKLCCVDAYDLPNNGMALGYQNNDIYLLTYSLNILKLEGDELVYVEMENNIAGLSDLIKYNFLEQFDFKMYYHWLTFLNKTTPVISIAENVTMRSYGDLLFLGNERGKLNIYNSLCYENVVKVINSQPIKSFDLMGYQILPTSPILHIDIIEYINSHKVIVAMPQRVIVINFNHY